MAILKIRPVRYKTNAKVIQQLHIDLTLISFCHPILGQDDLGWPGKSAELRNLVLIQTSAEGRQDRKGNVA